MNRARLVVLVVALAAGAGAAWFAGQGPQQKTVQTAPAQKLQMMSVLVAAQDLDPGRKLQAADMKWQEWPANNIPAGSITSASNANAPRTLQGAFVRTALAAGDPIRESHVIMADGSGYMAAMIGSGMRAVSTEITPDSAVAGFVLPNDQVDVLLTRPVKVAQGSDVFVTETILHGVRVLAIDQSVGEKSGQKVAIGKIATLELSPNDAERLALAHRLGTISLALRGLSDQNKSAGDASHDGITATINVVRFGVSVPTPPR